MTVYCLGQEKEMKGRSLGRIKPHQGGAGYEHLRVGTRDPHWKQTYHVFKPFAGLCVKDNPTFCTCI